MCQTLGHICFQPEHLEKFGQRQRPQFLLSFLEAFCRVHQAEWREDQHAETTIYALLNFVSLFLQENIPQSHHPLPGYPCMLCLLVCSHCQHTGWGLSMVQMKCKWEDVCLNVRERQVKLHSGRTKCKRIPCIHNEGHCFQEISLACPRATQSSKLTVEMSQTKSPYGPANQLTKHPGFCWRNR